MTLTNLGNAYGDLGDAEKKRDLLEAGDFWPLAEMGLMDLNGGPWTISVPVSPIEKILEPFDDDLELCNFPKWVPPRASHNLLSLKSSNVLQYIEVFLEFRDKANLNLTSSELKKNAEA